MKLEGEKVQLSNCNSNTKICAMCFHWNGYIGGQYVEPKVGMAITWTYAPNEKQICYKKHIEKSAWHSCLEWQKKY